jgi:hypothetical protein
LGTVTRTVVFTDLSNYTARVARSDREALRELLVEHEKIVTPLIEGRGGRVVKNLGDSFMCVFGASTDALRAALDIQHDTERRGSNRIRVAMATGDVEEIEGDAFGECVNLAARILSKAPGEEVWFSEGTRRCMNSAEIPWEYVQKLRLKGIPGERSVYRCVPEHKCYLPDAVIQAAKTNTLVRLRQGVRPPLLPPDPVILFEGFEPGSDELSKAVDSLPVLDPASLFIAAYQLSPEFRDRWEESGRGIVIGNEGAIEAAITKSKERVQRSTGSDTIVLEMGVQADLNLVMCGLALPAVPLSDVVASYSYDLLPDGRWVNRSERAVLRVEVTPGGVHLAALHSGVRVNGRGVQGRVQLQDGDKIATSVGAIDFRNAGQGYAGLLLADSDTNLGVMTGTTAELGREPQHPGLPFPDRRGSDNIRWCSGPRAARARAGGFTLDRALAGRRQAAVQMHGDTIHVKNLHPRCPTYVMRTGAPELQKVADVTHVAMNDLIIAGTSVVGLRPPE